MSSLFEPAAKRQKYAERRLFSIQPLFLPRSSESFALCNKTASAATTPAQTPRSSMQEQRTKPHKMTQEEALEKLMRVTMGDAANGPYIR
ncbi:hypothetical protein BGZ93_010584 [Podila epicladia]|nr:hypothetical protein BGZ92_002883 [Podila epicladia]KAG0088077.1 hypothetical protein BGZ93_010584 [Podila epicladia]